MLKQKLNVDQRAMLARTGMHIRQHRRLPVWLEISIAVGRGLLVLLAVIAVCGGLAFLAMLD